MTKKPRILVTLDQEDYDLVKRVAEASEVSMSALLREYVEMSRPVLQHMAKIADEFDQAKEERRQVHVKAVEGALEKGQLLADVAAGQLPLLYDFMEALGEAVSGDPVTIAEYTGGEAGEGAVVDTTPLASNRGVRSHKNNKLGPGQGDEK